MTVAEKLIELRNKSGLSQRQLAKNADITSQAINQYESGKRVPDIKCFAAICKALDTSLDSFMDGVIM